MQETQPTYVTGRPKIGETVLFYEDEHAAAARHPKAAMVINLIPSKNSVNLAVFDEEGMHTWFDVEKCDERAPESQKWCRREE